MPLSSIVPKGKLTMKTKLQRSKTVTMNKSDEKRQGLKVRTVVTGHNTEGRAVFVRDEIGRAHV